VYRCNKNNFLLQTCSFRRNVLAYSREDIQRSQKNVELFCIAAWNTVRYMVLRQLPAPVNEKLCGTEAVETYGARKCVLVTSVLSDRNSLSNSSNGLSKYNRTSLYDKRGIPLIQARFASTEWAPQLSLMRNLIKPGTKLFRMAIWPTKWEFYFGKWLHFQPLTKSHGIFHSVLALVTHNLVCNVMLPPRCVNFHETFLISDSACRGSLTFCSCTEVRWRPG